jgi:hypothetical protein
LLDPGSAPGDAPNESYTTGINGGPGIRVVRRTITTSSAVTLTDGLMRITSLSQEHGAPRPGPRSQPTNPAQLTLTDPATPTSDITLAAGTVTVQNLAVSAPAVDPPGGGLGTTLAIPFPDGGLAPGASVHVAVTLTAYTTGSYWFGYNVDAIDTGGPVLARQRVPAKPGRYAGAAGRL